MSLQIDLDAMAEVTDTYNRWIKPFSGDPLTIIDYSVSDLDEARKELDRIDDLYQGVIQYTPDGERQFVVIYKSVTVIFKEEE